MGHPTNIYKALATEFGATPAERVSGGFNGIMFVEKVTLELHFIDEAGEELTATIAGAPVIFTV